MFNTSGEHEEQNERRAEDDITDTERNVVWSLPSESRSPYYHNVYVDFLLWS